MIGLAAWLGGLAWLLLRALAPGLAYRLPPRLRPLWRLAVPAMLAAAAAWARPASGLALALLLSIATAIIRKRPAILRRELAALEAACRDALEAAGLPAGYPEVAACVLRQRDGRRPMTGAEAAALAGRCCELDDLGAQVALREGGFKAYAAYLRRFGRTGEVAAAETAAHGDRFPGYRTGGGSAGGYSR